MTKPLPILFGTFLSVIASGLTSGCVVHTSGSGSSSHGHTDVEVTISHEASYNESPSVEWADGGCYYDHYGDDYVWYFEADAFDPDGLFDVVAVYADVYDEYTGTLEDSFELFDTDDPYFWFSDWWGSSTYLDCHYDGYVVDIVAYDYEDYTDVYSFWPAVY